MPLNDTMYKLKGNKNITLRIFNNTLLILTLLSSAAGYSDQALYKVSQFNAPITSRGFDTIRLGFQHNSGGTAGKLNCYNHSEQPFLVPPNRSSAPTPSKVETVPRGSCPASREEGTEGEAGRTN